MAREREYPVMASSADDVRLRNQLIALSPTVREDEARRVARCAYTTGEELRRGHRPTGLLVFQEESIGRHTGASENIPDSFGHQQPGNGRYKP